MSRRHPLLARRGPPAATRRAEAAHLRHEAPRRGGLGPSLGLWARHLAALPRRRVKGVLAC